jgi:amino acid adenylation domain-containing protein
MPETTDTPSPGEGPFPLSHTQRAIWLDEQLHPASRRNHISLAVNILADLDHDAFARALHRVAAENPSLRTSFEESSGVADADGTGDWTGAEGLVEGDPVQRVAVEPRVDLRFVDAGGWTDAEVDDRLRTEHLRPFDLHAGHLVRFVILERAPAVNLLLITIHHLVADLWSIAVLGDLIASIYRWEVDGDGSASPPDATSPRPPRAPSRSTYRDFVRAEQEYLAGPASSRAGEFWGGLIGDSPAPGLVADHRPPDHPTGETAILDIALGEPLVEAIRTTARETGTSERSVVLAAYQALIHRHSNTGGVAIAELKAVRTTRTARLVGCCVNTVPRVASFTPDTTLAEVLDAADRQSRASAEHDSYPFDLIVRTARPRRGDEPIVDAAFGWQKTTRAISPELVSALAIGSADGATTLSGLPLEPYPLRTRSSPFDLTLLGVDDRSRTALRLAFEYQTERFDPTTIEHFAIRLRLLLEALTSQPGHRVGDVDLLTRDERGARVAEWEALRVPIAEVAVHRLVEERALADPDAVAVRADAAQVTYGELDERANRLAHRLIDAGVERGRLVGIALDRTIDMVASMLAVWKCGAGYVPMDPGFPAERLDIMATDAELDVIITTGAVWATLDPLPPREGGSRLDEASILDLDAEPNNEPPATTPAVEVAGADVAYVIFTSGSTGRPKGVAVEHHSLVNFVAAMSRRPGLDPSDVVLASTTLSFDISVLEILVPLTVGATIRLVDRTTVADPALLAPVLDEVTLAQGTPTMWNMLVMSGWRPTRELTVLCGGEPLSRALADALLARSGRVWNMYGPTETTIWSAVGRVAAGTGPVPIGDPIDNTRLYILDGEHLAPDGVAGELWIGGAGVARGYVGRRELTAERFAPDPFFGHGERMYRTGDLARRRPDGSIDFLGRVDDQVKLRGHRIELGEIEAVLETHPAVGRAVVAVRSFGADDDRLVGYYTPDDAAARGHRTERSTAAALREHLRARLPDYMVPAHYLAVDRFPRTPNDKVDRSRLPDPTVTGSSDHDPAPSSFDVDALDGRTLGIVLDAYREVMAAPAVGPLDDFFDHGGHSLLATRIASRLRRSLQRPIGVRTVLDHPSAAALALHIAELPAIDDAAPDLTSADSEPNSTFLPSWSQERMWFMHELHPDSAAYNLGAALELHGELDLAAFDGAWNRLVERHTALRSSFESVHGSPRVRVHAPFTLPVVLLDHRAAAGRDIAPDEIDALLRDRAARPFDLSVPPLFRVSLHRLAADLHVVTVVMHHAVSDQWSFGVMLQEFGEIYRARCERGPMGDTLPPAPRAELYAEWHRHRFGHDALAELRDYWRTQLNDLPTVELPTDRPRPAVASTRGASIVGNLPSELTAGARAAASSERSTEFMVHLAVLDVLIAERTGTADIPVGVPIANRHWLDSEDLVMSLVNTLVLRTDLSGAVTFRDVLRRVRSTALEAYAHQDMPFEQLVQDLAPRRELGRSPLFQVFLNVQNAPITLPSVEGLELSVRPIERRAAQHDISLSIDAVLTNTITLEYATDLYDRESMSRLLDDYLSLLSTAVGDLGTGLDTALPISPASPVGAPVRPASPVQAVPPRASGETETPRPGLESELAAIWASALGVTDVGRSDDFFALGGHSLLAVRMLSDVEELTGTRPPVSALFGAPDLASFTAAVATEGWSTRWTSLIEVQRGDHRRPFFYVSPFVISALSMHDLAEKIGGDVPFYTLQPQGIETDDDVHQRVEEMAAHYIDEMRTVQPTGPYLLGGHCGGAWVAFEMARQLQRVGEHLDALIVVDVEPPGIDPPPQRRMRHLWSRLTLYARTGRVLHSLRWQLRLRLEQRRARTAQADEDRTQLVQAVHRQAHRQYEGGTIEGDLTFIRSAEWAHLADKQWHEQWSTLASGRTDEYVVAGAHSELLVGDGADELAKVIRAVLDATQ